MGRASEPRFPFFIFNPTPIDMYNTSDRKKMRTSTSPALQAPFLPPAFVLGDGVGPGFGEQAVGLDGFWKLDRSGHVVDAVHC